MDKQSKIYVAGHRGLVGSAILRKLQELGYENLVYKTHHEVDLMRQEAVERFLDQERPEYVFLAAAKVGGIQANNTYPAEFIYDNGDDIINIGVGRDLTIRELAEMIGELVGFKGKLRFDVSKPDGTPVKRLDVSSLNALGWQARISLKKGIEQTYKWYLENWIR